MIGNNDSTYSSHSKIHRGGKSSFHMHDPELLFSKLNVRKGDYILDLGCGRGDYSIHLANAAGESGLVCAVDKSTSDIENLSDIAAVYGISNLNPVCCDIRFELPVESGLFNLCLISTVLHCLNNKEIHSIMNELKRVMKPRGRIFVIECKKKEMKMGPPLHMRISDDEMEKIALSHSLRKKDYTDLGMNYMLEFVMQSIDE